MFFHFRKIFLTLLCLLPVVVMAQTILVVGDSISAGYGIDSAQGWVALLKDRLSEQGYEYEVVNESVPGSTTSGGLARLPATLAKYHPSITIIQLGGNDGLRGISTTQIKQNLTEMITLTKAAGSQVLLLGLRIPLHFGPSYARQFQQLYIDIAQDQGVYVVPLLLNSIDQDRTLFQSDGIHPTAKAQSLILENVWPELKKILRY